METLLVRIGTAVAALLLITFAVFAALAMHHDRPGDIIGAVVCLAALCAGVARCAGIGGAR